MKMKYGSKEEGNSQNFLQQWNVLVNGVKRKSEEWKNKGIDVFASAMDKLAQKIYHSNQPEKEVVAFAFIKYCH